MTQHWSNLGQVPKPWRTVQGIPLTLEQAHQVFVQKAMELGEDTGRGHVNPSPTKARAAFIKVHTVQDGRWILKPGEEW